MGVRAQETSEMSWRLYRFPLQAAPWILLLPLTSPARQGIITEPGIRSIAWTLSRHRIARSIMNDFNRKVEDASARVGKTINEAAERLEKEIPEFIKYLNNEVVPAVRSHSTKALRVASQKLAEFADYMEQHPTK